MTAWCKGILHEAKTSCSHCYVHSAACPAALHLLLLDASSAAVPGHSVAYLSVQAFEAVLKEQAEMCQEILQMEQADTGIDDRSGQKWPLLTLARLREVQHQLPNSADSKCTAAQCIYQTLAEIDPLRKGYYTDAMQGKAAQVTRALK